jgi:hypothetical protein
MAAGEPPRQCGAELGVPENQRRGPQRELWPLEIENPLPRPEERGRSLELQTK